MLPLEDGWYVYDFERKMKGVEAEYMFTAQTGGMQMVQEITLLQKGTVIRIQNGSFLDPSILIDFSVDDSGNITSAGNPSISGAVFENGELMWSGFVDSGLLSHYEICGTLVPISESMRASADYNGTYRIKDQNSGRQQLVAVNDGLYTWRYLDYQEGDELFEAWPTLVRPNGAFGFEMELTTVLDMVNISRADFSTQIVMEGRIDPAAGLSMQQLVSTAGIGVQAQKQEPSVFSGNRISESEYSPADLPQSALAVLAAKNPESSSAYKKEADEPDWYSHQTRKEGFMTAVGRKQFADPSIALSMAEAVAAADLASRVKLRLKSEYATAVNPETQSMDRTIDAQSLLRLPYAVAEQKYSETTGTAWVMLELRREDAAAALTQ